MGEARRDEKYRTTYQLMAYISYHMPQVRTGQNLISGPLAIFISLVFFFGRAYGQQNDTSTLSGYILDKDGRGLPYATIQIDNVSIRSTLSDSTGFYNFKALRSGSYEISIQAFGYRNRTDTVFIKTPVQTQNYTLAAKSYLIDSLVVTSHSEKEVRSSISPFLSTSQVSREFILNNQGTDFMNTLEKFPGISSIRTGTGISKPVIRGMSFNRVIVNEFGIKQEDQQWGVEHGLEIDQFNVENVEIVKGPSSILYGSDGIAGVIHLNRNPFPAEDTIGSEWSLNYRSNNETLGGTGKWEMKKNGFWVKGRITALNFGDYKVPADSFIYNSFKLPIIRERLKNTAGRELNYYAHVGYERPWGHTVLSFSKYRQKAGFFSGAFGIPRSYQLQNDGNFRDIQLPHQRITHQKLISNTRLYAGKWKFNLDVGFQQNIRNEYSYLHSHGNGPAPTGNLALRLSLNTGTYNLRSEYSNSKSWTVHMGSTGQIQKNNQSGFEFLIPSHRNSRAGIYYLNEFRFQNNITWQSGARYDFLSQMSDEVSQPVYSGDSTIVDYELKSPKIRNRYHIPTFTTGIAWPIGKRSVIKYNLGTAFRIPTMAELTSNGVHHGTFRHELGNPDLNEESGILQNLEWGYTVPDWEIQIAPFYYYFQNYIYLRPSAGFSPLPDAGQIYNYQEGRVIITGFEINSRLRISRRWMWNCFIEWIKNKNLNLSYPLPFTPPFSILNEVGFEKKITANRIIRSFSIHSSLKIFSAQNQVDQNEKTTPGYYLIHFSFHSSFRYKNQNLDLRIQVRNLTDETYLNNMSRYRILNLPEQGRSLQLSILYGI